MCAAALVRGRWAGIVAVSLLIGVGGGVVLAAAAGARRSDTAATRLYARGKVADLELDPTSGSFDVHAIDLARLRRIPQVRRATAATFFALGAVRGGKVPARLDAFAAANADGSWIYDFDRIGLLPSFRGRLPDRSRVDEVVATTQQARLLHVDIGSSLHMAVAKFDDPNSAVPSSFEPVTLHVVGIATTPIGLLRGSADSESFLFASPAFARHFADRNVGSTIYVQLRDPSNLLAFERQVPAASPNVTFEIKPASQELSTFSRVANPYTNTLWIFALVAAIATLLIVAQALLRMIRTDGDAGTALQAVGTTSRQRAAIAAARAGLALLGGTILAVAVAIAASGLFPLGLVRQVEPDPGLRVDAEVLGLGALAILMCLGVVILASARQTARATAGAAVPSRSSRPSRTSNTFARANAPVSIIHGTRLAFQRGPETSNVSTAASIVGLVAAVAATAAALVFGANLDQLTTPRRYGQTWDAEIVSAGASTVTPDDAETILAHKSLTTGTTLGTFGDVKLDHQVVPAYGMQPRTGHVLPEATSGRLPTHDNEIALGGRTLRQLHLGIGDTVTATTSKGRNEKLHVVGQTLLPALNSNTPTLGADDGAELTRRGLTRLNPDLTAEVDFVLVDFARHVTLHDIRANLNPNDFTATGAAPPGYIASYGDVSSTPLILAGLIALLGIGVLAHLLITTVRTNRRELAIFKTLGSTRAQLSVMVIWQAIMLVICRPHRRTHHRRHRGPRRMDTLRQQPRSRTHHRHPAPGSRDHHRRRSCQRRAHRITPGTSRHPNRPRPRTPRAIATVSTSATPNVAIWRGRATNRTGDLSLQL